MTARPSILLSLAAALFVTACSGERDEANAGNAAMPMQENGMMTMGMTPAPGDSPATQGYKQSMNDMMANMPPFTGEPDEDFMRQMKVHHGSAIAMAQTELEHGTDPEARELAEKIIGEQRAEIAQIDAWLAARSETP